MTETVVVLIDGERVAVPVDAWEAALKVEKWRRTAFLLAQLHRAPGPCAAPACSLARPLDSGQLGAQLDRMIPSDYSLGKPVTTREREPTVIYLLHRLTVWNYRRKRAAACPRRLRRLPTTDAIIIAFVVASACYFCAHIVWYFIR